MKAEGSHSQASPRQRLLELLEQATPSEGANAQPWPDMLCHRATQPTELSPVLYQPCLCVVGRGAKEAVLGDAIYRYDALHYLVVGAPIPLSARIAIASPEHPFLSLVLPIDTLEVNALLMDMGEEAPTRPLESGPPIRVSRLDRALLVSLLRFLQSLQNPVDRRVLADGALREVIYRLLQQEQADLVRMAALREAQLHGALRALRYLQEHMEEAIDIAGVSRAVGMSPSSLHHTFKQATALSPMQYLKRLRLHRARQLIIEAGRTAGEAALQVGYSSPSHFSRDFKRLFGQPPRRYAASWLQP